MFAERDAHEDHEEEDQQRQAKRTRGETMNQSFNRWAKLAHKYIPGFVPHHDEMY